MRVVRDLAAFPDEGRGGVLSIGKFDGVHRGHGSILDRLNLCARDRKSKSVVFTFAPSPAEILRPHLAPPLLCTTDRKVELIARYNPDFLILFPTSLAFLRLSARAFFEEIVVRKLDAGVLVEGESFNFGSNRDGNTNVLSELCVEFQRQLRIVPSIHVLGRDVSSSRIRSLIREGQMEAARGMLGFPYRMTGYVVQGEHRGRRLGFPTANLGGVTTIIPKVGLYAALATVDGKSRLAAVNLGGNPTFGVQTTKIEAHLLDFNGDLYGKTIHLDFIARIRDIQTFPTQTALLQQIQKDLVNVHRVLLMSRLGGIGKNGE